MVMLTATVPPVAFQLVGGATSDRLSARKLMLASSVFRALVCSALTALVLTGGTRLWQFYVIAAAFGTADAFFAPAFKAFIPAIVEKEQLVAGNALLNGTATLTKFIGPSLAGVLIPFTGLSGAFGADTASFVFVAACLLLIGRECVAAAPTATPSAAVRPNMIASIRAGLSYTLAEPTLRALIIIIGAVEFAFAGPFTVGLASLAGFKFAAGPAAYGAMLTTLGGGLLVGTLTAGALNALLNIQRTLIPFTCAMGAGLALFGSDAGSCVGLHPARPDRRGRGIFADAGRRLVAERLRAADARARDEHHDALRLRPDTTLLRAYGRADKRQRLLHVHHDGPAPARRARLLPGLA